MSDDDKNESGAIALKEGEVPPFPAGAHVEGLAEGDKPGIAAAAWKQAFGSIVAFEQLCAEHARREIDLLTGKTGAEIANEKGALAEDRDDTTLLPLTAHEEARRVDLVALTVRTPEIRAVLRGQLRRIDDEAEQRDVDAVAKA